MKVFEITTSVKHGLFSRNVNRIKDAIATFEGKTVTLSIKALGKERTPKQNGYYWAVIIIIWQKIIQDEWGEFLSINEVHEFLKYNCNYIEQVDEETGQYVRLGKSTTENTTTDQEEFHEKCRRLALDMFNTEIPIPSEQIKIKL
jgi:hypothetical protein